MKKGFEKAGDSVNNFGQSIVNKVNEFKESKEFKEGSQKAQEAFEKTKNVVAEKTQDAVNAIKSNEDIMNALNTVNAKANKVFEDVKENVDGFMNKPEEAEKVEKAKDVTIDVAEKAVDALKNWLRPEDKE